MLEKQQYNNIDYYNNQANKWLREYLEQIGHGHKVNSDEEFANKCGIKYSRIRSMTGGNGPVYADDIIKFSKVTGISADVILGLEKKKVPDNLKVDTNNKVGNIETNILSQKVCDKLSKHILKDGLFPAQDEYLKFLEYLILEENYIRNLLDKSKQSLETFVEDIENNKISKKEIELLFSQKDFDNFVNTIKNNKELNERFKGIVTDTKIRNDIRNIIYKYIYDNLKK